MLLYKIKSSFVSCLPACVYKMICAVRLESSGALCATKNFSLLTLWKDINDFDGSLTVHHIQGVPGGM